MTQCSKRVPEACSTRPKLRRVCGVRLFGFHQLDAIAEGIVHIDAVIAFERFIVLHRVARCLELLLKSWQIFYEQCRMRFTSRPEIRLDAEMYFEITSLEPAAPTFGEVCRFWHLFDTERVPIKRSRTFLAARRHGQLHMFDSPDSHRLLLSLN